MTIPPPGSGHCLAVGRVQFEYTHTHTQTHTHEHTHTWTTHTHTHKNTHKHIQTHIHTHTNTHTHINTSGNAKLEHTLIPVEKFQHRVKLKMTTTHHQHTCNNRGIGQVLRSSHTTLKVHLGPEVSLKHLQQSAIVASDWSFPGGQGCTAFQCMKDIYLFQIQDILVSVTRFVTLAWICSWYK